MCTCVNLLRSKSYRLKKRFQQQHNWMSERLSFVGFVLICCQKLERVFLRPDSGDVNDCVYMCVCLLILSMRVLLTGGGVGIASLITCCDRLLLLHTHTHTANTFLLSNRTSTVIFKVVVPCVNPRPCCTCVSIHLRMWLLLLRTLAVTCLNVFYLENWSELHVLKMRGRKLIHRLANSMEASEEGGQRERERDTERETGRR